MQDRIAYLRQTKKENLLHELISRKNMSIDVKMTKKNQNMSMDVKMTFIPRTGFNPINK